MLLGADLDVKVGESEGEGVSIPRPRPHSGRPVRGAQAHVPRWVAAGRATILRTMGDSSSGTGRSVPDAATRRRMRNTRRRDTAFEMAVRRAVHARGLRFRVDRTIPAAGRARPDLQFPRARVAVFLDGCFWHSCPEHGTMPKRNADWWKAKIRANVERDRRHDREIEAAGWTVLRYWEHEDPRLVADRIEAAVRHAPG